MRGHWIERPGSFLFQFLIVCALTVGLGCWGRRVLAEARRATAEELALITLRQISQAVELYRMAQQHYPEDLTALGPPTFDPPYLPPELIGDGTLAMRQGYRFVYEREDPQRYTLRANPLQEGVTGERHYFASDALGAVHVTTEARDATAEDPLAQ